MVTDEQTQLAAPIARALDDLHDALLEAQKRDTTCKSWSMRSATCRSPPCAYPAPARASGAAPSTWSAAACSLDDSRGYDHSATAKESPRKGGFSMRVQPRRPSGREDYPYPAGGVAGWRNRCESRRCAAPVHSR